MLVGMHANKGVYFIYDPLADKGQRESVARAVKVYIGLEFESFTIRAENQTKAPDQWGQIPCSGQNQPDNINCGVLVLIAFFRVVNLLANNQTYDICVNWYCSITTVAFQKYRKELLHLLTDVREVDDPNAAAASNSSSSRSNSRRKEKDDVPKPGPGRSFAGFLYFKEVLLPWLEMKDNTRY